jgi:hypothetical protein
MELNINFAMELNIFVEFNKYANSNSSFLKNIYYQKRLENSEINTNNSSPIRHT